MTNTMTNTYVVIFLSVSIFGRGYHSRYQNFEFTGVNSGVHFLHNNTRAKLEKILPTTSRDIHRFINKISKLNKISKN